MLSANRPAPVAGHHPSRISRTRPPPRDERNHRIRRTSLIASSVAGAMGVPTETETVPFLDAARGRPVTRTPVWFMRQAGRSLPEYRAIRGEGSILDAIKRPDLAAEITLQPVRRYGVDAAVLFSDIVVPAHAVGFGIDVAPGTGPVAEHPLRTPGRSRPSPPAHGRRRRLRRRHRPPADHRTARRRAAARLRRRAVHRRQLPDRRPAEPRLPPHEGADPRRRGAVARPDGAPRRVGDHVHRCPAQQRCRRLPAVRLVGRLAEPARLRPVRAAPLAARVRRAPRPPSRRPGDPLRDRLRPPPRIDACRRTDRARARLAYADQRRPPPPRRRPRRPGQPRPGARARRDRRRAGRNPPGARRQRRRAGSHLQPRSRRAPRHRSRGAAGGRRSRPRAGDTSDRMAGAAGRRGPDGVRHAGPPRRDRGATTPTSAAAARPHRRRSPTSPPAMRRSAACRRSRS